MGDIKKKHLDGEGLDYLIEQLDERYSNPEVEVPTQTSDLTNDSGFISEIPVATLTEVGGIKPDGSTVTVDSDGTLHATSGAGGGADMTNYYTKSQTEALIPNELADLTGDSNHRTVTDSEKAAWNNKSNFSGSYNDLSNKPSSFTPSAHTHNYSDITNIPKASASTAGVVKVDGTTIVADANGVISSVGGSGGGGSADLSNYYTKSEVDGKIPEVLEYSGHTGGDYDKVPTLGEVAHCIDEIYHNVNSTYSEKSEVYTKSEVDELLSGETIEPSRIRKEVFLDGTRVRTKDNLEPIPTYDGSTTLVFENNVLLRVVKNREMVNGVLQITDYEDYSGSTITIPNTISGYLDDYVIYNFITSAPSAEEYTYTLRHNTDNENIVPMDYLMGWKMLEDHNVNYENMGRNKYLGTAYGGFMSEDLITKLKEKWPGVGASPKWDFTDEDGYYGILDISPGTYTIENLTDNAPIAIYIQEDVNFREVGSVWTIEVDSDHEGEKRLTEAPWDEIITAGNVDLERMAQSIEELNRWEENPTDTYPNAYSVTVFKGNGILNGYSYTMDGYSTNDRYFYYSKSEYTGNRVTFTIPSSLGNTRLTIFNWADKDKNIRNLKITRGTASYSELVAGDLSGTVTISGDGYTPIIKTIRLYDVMAVDQDYIRYSSDSIYKYYDLDGFVGKWTLIGTTNGSSAITLPKSFNELFIVMKCNAWNNFVMTIPALTLVNDSAVSDADVPGGEYYKDGSCSMNSATVVYADNISYLISKTRGKLSSYTHNEGNTTQQDLTQYALTYWYYR